VTLTTTPAGLGSVGLLPLDGSLANAPTVPVALGTISTDPTDSWVGQVIPGNETITAISASFETSAAVLPPPGTLLLLTAQVYVSDNGGVTYNPLTGTAVGLPLSGIVTIGSVSSGALSGLDVTIPTGDLGLVVFSASDPGSLVSTNVTGSATVGVSYTSG